MASTEHDLGQYHKIGGPPAYRQHAVTEDNNRRGKSWKAPITMIIALFAGIALAFIHHFLNAYLNGRVVRDVRISQTWISRITTALAFLVKTCWVATAGVAFVQRQWLNLHQDPLRVKDIDALTGILESIFSFLGTTIWFRNPLLTTMAIITWTIPFAAVITPGSLSVQQLPALNRTRLPVPQLNYVGTTYGQLGAGSQFGVVHANNLVYKLGYTTAVTGARLLLPSANQNETYRLNFDGPAVRCQPANQSVTNAAGGRFRAYDDHSGNIISYLSWVGGDDRVSAASSSSSSAMKSFDSSDYATVDITSTDVSRIFIMTNNYTKPNVTVTECQLYNATYEADFSFQNMNQTQYISEIRYLNPVPASQCQLSMVTNTNVSAILAYSSVMEVFGRILVGYVGTSHYGVTTRLLTSSDWLSINWTDAALTQRGLESLFQNITLSLFSDNTLTKNASEAVSVPVTIKTFPVTYHYNIDDLWIAYGISGFCALLCFIVGMHAFSNNQASYQNVFSTFIRSTSRKEIQHLIYKGDDGADPLPKDLAASQVTLSRSNDYAMKLLTRRNTYPTIP